MSTVKSSDDSPIIKPGVSNSDNGDSSLLTDTIAAVVSAILALVFVMLVVCIIQAIKKRRQERQGRRLGQPVVHTITPGIFGTSLSAYRHCPVSGSMSWENVPSSQDLQSQYLNEPSTSSSSNYAVSASSTASLSLSPDAGADHRPSTSKIPFQHEITNGISRTLQPSVSSSSSLSVSSSKSGIP